MLIKLSKTTAQTRVVPEFRHKYEFDWKELQKKMCWFEDIKADAIIKQFVDSHPSATFDVEWAAPDIKKYVEANAAVGSDFFIITNREFSKNSLPRIEEIIHQKMAAASIGGYVALLSYYLNWTGKDVDKTLPDLMSKAVDCWVNKFPYRVDNVSQVNDYPIYKSDSVNYRDTARGLYEGKNFLFSHPNVRFWLWK